MTSPDYNTARLLGGDIVALRGQYLGYFAQICHINPIQVDALRMYDWAKLVLFIEDVIKKDS